MSGMIPGVGVPHRRRVHHHNHSHRVHSSTQNESFLRERQNPSMDLSETALKARQRLEKKLGYCLQLNSRSNDDKQTKETSFLGSSKLVKFSKSWKSQSPNKDNESDRKVCSCC
ncbi:uncharacterized protein LOC112090824 [Morus notabilis]|uniref:uncharacterized protein LOC112090824 n=1 Tax=Morus notabilis TaxID=981085 RepID=UPI000CED6341|nr:uncharacterized protein LOC112090824 [Morus notabilis]